MSAGEDSNSSSEPFENGVADAWINVLPGQFNSGSNPSIEIVEQPMARGHRFRYKCEGKSHGVIKGCRSVDKHRTFPAIKVHNYTGKALIRVTLVTESGAIHEHELTGDKCKDGIYEDTRNINNASVQFQDLCILHVTKKDADAKRKQRGIEIKKGKGKKSDINTKIVHLKFQVSILLENGMWHWLQHQISGPIYDGKGTDTSKLEINRLSVYSSPSTGLQEVFLLCDKVNKDDIMVRFYEINAKGDQVWEAEGQFGPSDVHHQVAIVFRTPSYFDSNIRETKKVKVQLVRKSDGEKSDGVDFEYNPPRNSDLESVDKKRKKPIPGIKDAGDIPMVAKGRGRGRKPKAQNSKQTTAVKSPAGVTQMQMSPQTVNVQSPASAVNSPPMAIIAENDVQGTDQNDMQQDFNIDHISAEELAMLLTGNEQMVMSQPNRQVVIEPMQGYNEYVQSPGQVPSPAHSSVSGGSRPPSVNPGEVPMEMSPQSYDAHSPYQVVLIDGVTYVNDETGSPVRFDALANSIFDENGHTVTITQNDLTNGQFDVVAIQDNQQNTNIYMQDTTAVSTAGFSQQTTTTQLPQTVYNNNEAAAAVQNLPIVMAKNDIETDDVPVSMGTIETDDVVMPKRKSGTKMPIGKGPLNKNDIETDDVPVSMGTIETDDVVMPKRNLGAHQLPHEMGKGMLHEERMSSVIDSGLGSLRSIKMEDQADSVKEEPADAAHEEKTEPEVPKANKTTADDSEITKQMSHLTLKTPAKESSRDNGSTKPTVDVSTPLTPPEDVENRAAGTARTNQGKIKRLIVRRRRGPMKCTQRGFNAGDRMAVSGEMTDHDMQLASKMSQGLQYFAQTGDIKYLLALQRHLIDVPDGAGDNAIHLAIIHRKLEPLRHLLNTNKKIKYSNAVNAYNEDKQTPLHLAVLLNEDYMVELLMEYGAKLDLINASGDNPLQLAAKMGFHRCIQSMLTKGEGVHVTREFLSKLNYEGYAALHSAVISGVIRSVEHLVHAGADVNVGDGKTGYTPLHFAVEQEDMTIVGYLLMQESIEPNLPGYNGSSALHLAAGRGNLGIAAALISRGGDPEAESAEPLEEESEDEDKDKDTAIADDVRCLTPLDIAQGNSRLVRILKGETYSNASQYSDRPNASLHPQPAAIPEVEKEQLTVLDVVTRIKLSKLLDSTSTQGANWAVLAKLFDTQEIAEVLATCKSPTLSLLDDLEASEVTVFELKEKLIQMNRMDAVEAIHEALNISEKARRDHALEKESQAQSDRR